MTSKRDSRCFVLALAPDASASTKLPCLAYKNVPLSTYCKIRHVSKFTVSRHRSVLPAIAQLSCTYLLYRALMITWPLCSRWCELRQSFADGRVLLSRWWLTYDRLFLSNSCAHCSFSVSTYLQFKSTFLMVLASCGPLETSNTRSLLIDTDIPAVQWFSPQKALQNALIQLGFRKHRQVFRDKLFDRHW